MVRAHDGRWAAIYLLVLVLGFEGVASAEPGYHEVDFPSAGGIAVHADVYPAKSSATPWIILFHQAGWSRGEYREIAPKLVDKGYAVLAAAQFPTARRFWLGVHWVADSELEWARPVRPSEINQRFLPNLLDNIEAAALAVDDGPRPNAGTWCFFCNYRSVCPAGRDVRFEPVDDEEPDPNS